MIFPTRDSQDSSQSQYSYTNFTFSLESVLYHPVGLSKLHWGLQLWSCLMAPGHIRTGDHVIWILGQIFKCKLVSTDSNGLWINVLRLLLHHYTSHIPGFTSTQYQDKLWWLLLLLNGLSLKPQETNLYK